MRSLRAWGDRVLLVVVVLCCCLLQWTTCLPLGESHGGIMWEKEPEDLCSLCQVGDHIMAQKILVTVTMTDLCLRSSRKPSIRMWTRAPRFEYHLLLYFTLPLEGPRSLWGRAWRLTAHIQHNLCTWRTKCLQCKEAGLINLNVEILS